MSCMGLEAICSWQRRGHVDHFIVPQFVNGELKGLDIYLGESGSENFKIIFNSGGETQVTQPGAEDNKTNNEQSSAEPSKWPTPDREVPERGPCALM